MKAEQLDPAQVEAKWRELAPLVDRMMERVGTKGEFPVEARSALAGDDQAATPFQTSHVLKMCLGAGVDHLHALKVLVVDAGAVHVAAPNSLARGALENFAAAYWILGPNQRNERVSRTLRWYAKNVKDQHTALLSLGMSDDQRRDAKLDALAAIAKERSAPGNVIRSGYTSTAAVEYAESNAPDLPLGVVLPWRLCSGFAHGRPWAYLGTSKREEEPSPGDPDVVLVRFTSDRTRVLYPALASLQLLERFLRLYEARAGRPLAPR
jgi:hypothetical protein